MSSLSNVKRLKNVTIILLSASSFTLLWVIQPFLVIHPINLKVLDSGVKPDILKNMGITLSDATQPQPTTHIPMLTSAFDDLPDITLYIRTSMKVKKLETEVYCDLLRTATLYWSNELGGLRFVLDEESEEDRKWAEALLKRQNELKLNFSFRFEPLPKDMQVLTKFKKRSIGYNRQLYSSFLIDQYVDTDVVAWVDTDCRFTTPVTPRNIINGKKLRVKGMDTFRYPWIHLWDKVTRLMLGKAMVSDFMVYFPVYIWKDTIKNCRNHILRVLNVSNIADAILKNDAHACLSPVNVIMTYAYYFERNRYDWHIDVNNKLNRYNKRHLLPGFELRPDDVTADMHVSVHGWRYRGKGFNEIISTYCAAINDTIASLNSTVKCNKFQNTLPMVLFEFCNGSVKQGHLHSWCRDDNIHVCHDLLRHHFNRVHELVNRRVYDLDLNRVKLVEIMAAENGIKCEKYFH